MESSVVEALASGNGFVDLSSWRKVGVSGADALAWLNDLISADISDLEPGRATRTLLLSPTGRIRAEFTVAVPGGNLVLLQDPTQPAAIDALLSPYTLSSDVELDDRTNDVALFAFPGRSAAPDPPGTALSAPSCTGAGVDLLAPTQDHEDLRTSLSKAFTLASSEDLESWRVTAGVPRFGVDATGDDLPQEAGFADAVSFDKGCYLGQEAVAKVRNLGHPRRELLHFAANGPVSRGDALEADGRRIGDVTSAAAADGRWWVLARVRWEAREGPFCTSGGVELTPMPRP